MKEITVTCCNQCPAFEENSEAGECFCKLVDPEPRPFMEEELPEDNGNWKNPPDIQIPEWCPILLADGEITLRVQKGCQGCGTATGCVEPDGCDDFEE